MVNFTAYFKDRVYCLHYCHIRVSRRQQSHTTQLFVNRLFRLISKKYQSFVLLALSWEEFIGDLWITSQKVSHAESFCKSWLLRDTCNYRTDSKLQVSRKFMNSFCRASALGQETTTGNLIKVRKWIHTHYLSIPLWWNYSAILRKQIGSGARISYV